MKVLFVAIAIAFAALALSTTLLLASLGILPAWLT